MQSNNDTIEEQPALAAETNINTLIKSALARVPSPDPDVEADFDEALENEFTALEDIRATVRGQVTIDTTSKEDLSAFDPANFIATGAAIVAYMPAKKVDYISLRKPSASEYVRVTHDKAYRMSPVYLLSVKKEIKTIQYLITGRSIGEVLSAVGNKLVKAYSIVLAINSEGNPFLWYVREGAEDEWSESAVILQSQAIDEWLRIEGAGSHYIGIRPQSKLNDPKWPTESFPQLLKLAFGSRIISSVDHPAIRAILGITA
jgi:hypothetical protein